MAGARRRESGTALLVTMLLMVMMGLIGFAALETVTRDQRVAGFQKRKAVAFHAADAGVAASIYALRSTGDPTVAATTIGDSDIHPFGLPEYSMDTSSGAAVADLGASALPGMNLALGQNGLPKFTLRVWRARVKGEAVGGTVSRIEFASGTLEAN